MGFILNNKNVMCVLALRVHVSYVAYLSGLKQSYKIQGVSPSVE